MSGDQNKSEQHWTWPESDLSRLTWLFDEVELDADFEMIEPDSPFFEHEFDDADLEKLEECINNRGQPVDFTGMLNVLEKVHAIYKDRVDRDKTLSKIHALSARTQQEGSALNEEILQTAADCIVFVTAYRDGKSAPGAAPSLPAPAPDR